MDSSPDLSLKLRRGSSDSRDSYYMDFAQGIDSDIEEVTTIAAAAPTIPGQIIIDSPTIQSPSDTEPDDNHDIEDLHDDEILESVDEPLPPAPPAPLLTSTLTTSSENNNSTTDDDEDISQIAPLPMPILPPIPIQMLQNSPNIPLVDDDEG